MDNVDNPRLIPGARVLVFDSRLFRDDVSTPLSFTMRPATIVARYGRVLPWMLSANMPWEGRDWVYPDLVDVLFDHRPERVSEGHFTQGVEEIPSCSTAAA